MPFPLGYPAKGKYRRGVLYGGGVRVDAGFLELFQVVLISVGVSTYVRCEC